jgi:tetratricopeptide (TPR) repeat protein
VGAFALPLAADAQGSAPVDTLAEARRLSDAKEYAAAATLLAAYTESHPDDVGSARFAALMAYWSKNFSSASAIYSRALERHPSDAELRLEAAQFFGNVGQSRRARELISPMVDSGDRSLATTRGAVTLLGTLEYWGGNLAGARALFADALRLDSTNADARRQLREIELASASWIAVGAALSHDDQPIDRVAPDLELGWYANPVTPLSLRLSSTASNQDDISESVSIVEGTATTFLAAAHLDLSLSLGLVDRTFGERSDWTTRAALGFRLPRNLGVEGSFQRSPYINTFASLTTAVMTQTVAGTLRLHESKGWLGEGSVRREAFDDDNSITSAFAWLLAPVARRARGQLQLGYSFAAQSAERSRFVARPDELDFPPGQAPATVRGYYNPYYTPRNLRAHSVLAAGKVRTGDRWSIAGNGALGVAAFDDAPVLFTRTSRPPDVEVARTFYRRSFTPWKIDGTLEGNVSNAVRLALVAAHSNGAFYAQTTAGLRVTYTFVDAARRRADRY